LTEGRERRFFLFAGLFVYVAWLFVFDSVGRTAAMLPARDLMLQLDTRIPFVAAFVWPYLLGYLYPLLPYFALKDWHRFNVAVLAVILGNLAAYAVYFLYPLAFSKPVLGPGLADRVLAYHTRLDFDPGANKLPSFHVAAVWIAVLACRKQRLGRWGDAAAIAGAVLVSVSTLFVKKHVILDVLAGFLLASLAWFAARRLYPALSGHATDAVEGFKRMVRKVGPAALACLIVLFTLVGLFTGKVPPWVSRLFRL
jgi:membrane-associated phospholipid phosphatase